MLTKFYVCTRLWIEKARNQATKANIQPNWLEKLNEGFFIWHRENYFLEGHHGSGSPERARYPQLYRSWFISSFLLVEQTMKWPVLQFTAINPVTSKIAALPHQALQAHNRYRALHHSPSLNWSEGLATEAQAIAQSLATQDLHAGRKDSAMDLGQNLAKLAGMNKSIKKTKIELRRQPRSEALSFQRKERQGVRAWEWGWWVLLPPVFSQV